ncbi:coiled-coil domain-containing protein 6-like [Dermacentor andersoni]|uniref:coiled-coil domain-containing protein 6-like n=1 Tax=Dermacentor andersoni TaxID=34620 RepID=UPI002155E24E|nr:coiled-coil domain-containing protein 6-like [Dermacentor andersoni]
MFLGGARSMADSASESDSSSVDGAMIAPSPLSREQIQKRVESLQQENRVLKMELETYRLRVKTLQEENRALRQVSVNIQAKAEQEEEFISNTLLKKIQALKKEKETLALNYEQEEECLTNDLSRKLNQLRQEKVQLEQSLEQEQEALVNKLMRKIERLEAQTLAKQANLEQLRREKVELECTLEQEQEALVNRLWKRMDKLEAEKRLLQERLEQPPSAPPSPREPGRDTPAALGAHVARLRGELARLRAQLHDTQQEHNEKVAQFAQEERQIREENVRLQRKLQLEMDRRESLCRHLSESESSLEMDEERHFNEMSAHAMRPRTVSSPIPYNPSPNSSRPLSPGLPVSGGPGSVLGSLPREALSPSGSLNRCQTCGQPLFHPTGPTAPPPAFLLPSPSPPTVNMLPPHPASFPSSNQARVRTSSQERFSRAPAPATPVVSPIAPSHLSAANPAPPTVPAAASPMMD